MAREQKTPFDVAKILIDGFFFMLNCAAVICLVAIIVAYLRGFHIVKAPTADELYGCTLAQQAPNGDCP